jgi:Arc/MetJ-type ribon-helix-helix transcriptional regulator
VQTRIESGRYENAGELMRAAFRALHREERTPEPVRSTSAIAEGDAFRRLWEISARSSNV